MDGTKLELDVDGMNLFFAMQNEMPDPSPAEAVELTHVRQVVTSTRATRSQRVKAHEKISQLLKARAIVEKVLRSISERKSRKDDDCDMQCIVPYVYIGNIMPAQNKELLKSKGISHVCCCVGYPPPFPDDFSYLVLDVDDNDSEDISRFFSQSFDFINSAVRAKHAVLIHCGAGISRSGAIAVAYIMRVEQINLHPALRVVQSARACVSPNPGFMAQLRRFESELARARHNTWTCTVS
jgi:hypothetical protein